MRKIEIKGIMLLSAAFLFVIGCAPEKKIASEYLSTRKDIAIVIKAPQWVELVSQIPDSLDSVPSITKEYKENKKIEKAKILSKLSEPKLINNYIISMKRGFESMGYKTYLWNNQDSTPPVKGNAIFINIGQIEIDEGIHPIRDEVNYRGHLYAADFDLTKIELCFWIELNRLENGVPTKKPRVFYTSFKKMDEFEGHFILDEITNEMKYSSSSLDITPDYVSGSMTKLGNNHASNLNTLLMNEYISYMLSGKQLNSFYSVDESYGVIIKVNSLPFTELKE